MKPETFEKWEEILEAEAEHAKAVVFALLNSDGDIYFCNNGFSSIFNIVPEGDDFKNYLASPQFETLVLYSGQPKCIFEGVLTVSDGVNNFTSYSGKIYSGHDEFFIFAEHDVQEIRRINTSLNQLNREVVNLQRKLIKEKKTLENTLNELYETQQMLVHSEKMNALGHLVAGVAHEINNPIAFVTSNLYSFTEVFENLSKAYIDAEQRLQDLAPQSLCEENLREKYDLDFAFSDTPALFKSTIDGLQRVKKIVENLRTFSRHDESEYKESNLEENIQATVALARAELCERNISVEYSINSPENFFSYVSELNQVFLNIILNAAEAIGSDGTIKIRSSENDENIIIEIEDDGPGIPGELKSKIFNPFFTTKEVGEGTGLGLSIASSIIEKKHGGSLSVESEINKGSIFKISIPRRIKNGK